MQALAGAPRAIRDGRPAGPSMGEGHPPGPLTALRARLRGSSIDRELASGTPPWTSRVLAARALQITRERSRANLARTLELVAERSERPAVQAISAVVPVCRDQVREALPQILSLASRLRDGAAIDARGVARLVALLSDGTGPLYVTARAGTLRALLEDVSRDLAVHD